MEHRQWEAREARLLICLERAEEERQTARATAAEDGENTRLQSQVGALKAELETVQSVLNSLNAENSRLAQENERLNQGDHLVTDRRR